MSAERFFDDMARTLAEPMPRRRVVRMLGLTLAASMVPGAAPRLARAASRSTTQVTCRGDRRTCQKGAEEHFEEYCCPSPSWRWFCGGQSNHYACFDRCPTGKDSDGKDSKLFPCTAAIAHPDSGIKDGVCCDRRLHSGCAPVGVVPGQEWKPSCCLKGPGVKFCGGLCCVAPNRCRGGRCRCPDGTASLDGLQCCPRGERPAECFRFGTRFAELLGPQVDASTVGRKCCPGAKPWCCGTKCCSEFGCCGTKCCSHKTSRCASWKGKTMCCPKRRVTGVGNEQICCPAGTISITHGFAACCPPNALTCCGGPGNGVECAPSEICVRGVCVKP